MKTKTYIAVLTVACVTLTLGGLACVDVYIVRDSGDATLLWSPEEAYLFINVTSRGYRFSGLNYLAEFVKNYFNVSSAPTNETNSTGVVRVVPPTVQHYLLRNISFDIYAPSDHNIYARSRGIIWKWTGTNFEKATPEEQQKLQGATPHDFDNIHGWSRHFVGGPPYQDVRMDVGNEPVVLSVTHNSEKAYLSFDLRCGTGPSERVFYLDEGPHRVSKAEFRRFFEQH
jgi:hypothetical protein